MNSKLVIVDYGMGNLNSVKKMMDRLKIESVVSDDPKAIIEGEKIILPGVGHFGQAMSNLKRLNLLDALREAVLIKRKPLLGICLGMQLLAKHSEEGDSEGLGWFDAEVVKFNIADKLKYKIPHLGWNCAAIRKNSRLMQGIADFSEFYFVHSYHVKMNNQVDVIGETEFEYVFPSVIEKENIFGVQFHPEKSHEAGARLLKNFVEI